MKITITKSAAEAAAERIIEKRINIMEPTVIEVTRACGCITTHRLNPGTGGTWTGTPSRQKYAAKLALTVCFDCRKKLHKPARLIPAEEPASKATLLQQAIEQITSRAQHHYAALLEDYHVKMDAAEKAFRAAALRYLPSAPVSDASLALMRLVSETLEFGMPVEESALTQLKEPRVRLPQQTAVAVSAARKAGILSGSYYTIIGSTFWVLPSTNWFIPNHGEDIEAVVNAALTARTMVAEYARENSGVLQ